MTSQSRTAIVTGAAGGIGRATASRLAGAGWKVIGVDRQSFEAEFEVLVADVAIEDDRSRIVSRVDSALGVLVNNAAIQINQRLVDTSDDEWMSTIGCNLTAPFQLVRDLHAPLASGNGAIVNVASVHAFATSVSIAAYAVSKAALVQLTRSAALEFGDSGVRCNAVAPGAVRTPMLDAGLSRRPHADGPEGNLKDLAERTPLRSVAEPGQIASVIEFLADNEWSRYITGQTIIADGGATLRLGTE